MPNLASRSRGRWGEARAAVAGHHVKQARIRALAEAWLAANRLGHLDVRFDVIAIDGVTLTHHESAF